MTGRDARKYLLQKRSEAAETGSTSLDVGKLWECAIALEEEADDLADELTKLLDKADAIYAGEG